MSNKQKSRGAITKKLKLTNGGDPKKGKFKVGVVGRCHRMIKKRRQRVLSGKKQVSLSAAHNRYKSVF